jgi:hypothetical protein
MGQWSLRLGLGSHLVLPPVTSWEGLSAVCNHILLVPLLVLSHPPALLLFKKEVSSGWTPACVPTLSFVAQEPQAGSITSCLVGSWLEATSWRG